MTFFNKKEEVIDLKLTRFGKNLLSRGAFKPVYYQFFDDDIIYDISRAGASEGQNDSEPRIKSDIRLKTQHLAVCVEESYDHQEGLIEEEHRGVFVDLKRRMDPAEEEKILKYPLATTPPGTQIAPSFFINLSDAQFTGSLTYNSVNGMVKNIPQLEIEPEYTYYIDRSQQLESPDLTLIDPEMHLDVTSEVIEFNDQSRIILDKEDIFMNIEEGSSFYGLKSFELEFYEETEAGSDTYVIIKNRDEILKYFNILTDEEAQQTTNPEHERNRSPYSR